MTNKEMQSLSILESVVLEIKTEIAAIVTEEKEALEVSSDVIKNKRSPSCGTGGVPRSRFTVHKPLQKEPLQPTEKLSDDDLVAFTLNAIQDSYKSRWQSLSVMKKKDRIKDFTSEYVRSLGLSSERVKDLYDILYQKIMIDKSLKAKDLSYDESVGKLMAVANLTFTENEFRFVKASQSKRDCPSSTPADQDEDAAIPNLVGQPTRKPPVNKSKIEKTMAKMKRKT